MLLQIVVNYFKSFLPRTFVTNASDLVRPQIVLL